MAGCKRSVTESLRKKIVAFVCSGACAYVRGFLLDEYITLRQGHTTSMVHRQVVGLGWYALPTQEAENFPRSILGNPQHCMLSTTLLPGNMHSGAKVGHITIGLFQVPAESQYRGKSPLLLISKSFLNGRGNLYHLHYNKNIPRRTLTSPLQLDHHLI